MANLKKSPEEKEERREKIPLIEIFEMEIYHHLRNLFSTVFSTVFSIVLLTILLTNRRVIMIGRVKEVLAKRSTDCRLNQN